MKNHFYGLVAVCVGLMLGWALWLLALCLLPHSSTPQRLSFPVRAGALTTTTTTTADEHTPPQIDPDTLPSNLTSRTKVFDITQARDMVQTAYTCGALEALSVPVPPSMVRSCDLVARFINLPALRDGRKVGGK